MKFILLIISLLLVPLVSAGSTFFDNPDDAFIIFDSTTGGVIGGTSGGTAGIGGCIYKWNCTSWGACLPSGKQARNCTNAGTCISTYNPPAVEQNCASATSPETGKEPGNETEEQKETEEQTETGKASKKGILDNRMLLYFIIVFIIVLVIGFIIFYLKKYYGPTWY